jgi:hypothetical protein
MAITVTSTYQWIDQATSGQYLSYAKLVVSGLTAGANNTVPHGLTDGKGNGVAPLQVSLEPTSNNTFYEYQAADTTNIYVGVGAVGGSGTTVNIYVVY